VFNSGRIKSVISQLVVAWIYFCDLNIKEVVLNMNIRFRKVEMEGA
jgi:hypothetical protein